MAKEDEDEEEDFQDSPEKIDFDQTLKLKKYQDSEKDKRVRLYMDSKSKILSEGIEMGLEKIIGDRPTLVKRGQFLMNNIDKPTIKKYFQKQYEQILKKTDGGLSEKDIYGLVSKIASYVESGKAFNNTGKELILKKGLKDKANENYEGFFHYLRHGEFRKAFTVEKRRAKRILKKEPYVDKAIDSFANLYELMKTGDYAERMPELSKTINEVYDLGFFDVAADILFQGKLLNSSKYESLKKTIHRRAKEGVEYTQKSLVDYLAPQKAAAAVLGVIGLGSLLMNNSITGNVVGVGNPNLFGLLGGILLLVSGIWLWFKKSKSKNIKKNKKYKKKIKSKTKKKKKR